MTARIFPPFFLLSEEDTQLLWAEAHKERDGQWSGEID